VARTQKLLTFHPHREVHQRGHDLGHGLGAFSNELFHDGGNDRIAGLVWHRAFLLGGRNIP
jgi:hypothetical protein